MVGLWNITTQNFRLAIPADLAAAPSNAAGIAATIQPNAPTNDNIWARLGDLEERTRWKYTCHGIPPQI